MSSVFSFQFIHQTRMCNFHLTSICFRAFCFLWNASTGCKNTFFLEWRGKVQELGCSSRSDVFFYKAWVYRMILTTALLKRPRCHSIITATLAVDTKITSPLPTGLNNHSIKMYPRDSKRNQPTVVETSVQKSRKHIPEAPFVTRAAHLLRMKTSGESHQGFVATTIIHGSSGASYDLRNS